MGIVHDTGVFKHTNTTRKTMETAGALLEKGIHSEDIIDRTFYKKSYVQNQIVGRALMESIMERLFFPSFERETLTFMESTAAI